MGKIISFMHITLDGFVANSNRELNWAKVNEEIFTHIGKRIAKCETAMYGRVTYEMMQNYWPTAGEGPNASQHQKEHSVWYKNVSKVVLSNSLEASGLSYTTIVNGNIPEKLENLKRQSNSEILLFGSPSATHSLMKMNMIDGFWLFVHPVLLGTGIPLFKDNPEKINLSLLDAHQFNNGVLEINYLIDKSIN